MEGVYDKIEWPLGQMCLVFLFLNSELDDKIDLWEIETQDVSDHREDVFYLYS